MVSVMCCFRSSWAAFTWVSFIAVTIPSYTVLTHTTDPTPKPTIPTTTTSAQLI